MLGDAEVLHARELQPALALAKRVLNHHLRKDLESVLAVELVRSSLLLSELCMQLLFVTVVCLLDGMGSYI